jgi:hypothetical protein
MLPGSMAETFRANVCASVAIIHLTSADSAELRRAKMIFSIFEIA